MVGAGIHRYKKEQSSRRAKGYYSTVEIKQCIDEKIDVVVPPTSTGQEQRNRGKFGKEMFVYDKERDTYICPNNERIPGSHSNHTSYARTMHLYRTSSKVCKACPLQTQCLGEKAIKTGDIEAIKQEIAEHIAAFSEFLAHFLLWFGFRRKRVGFR